jgi:hypothetical protein
MTKKTAHDIGTGQYGHAHQAGGAHRLHDCRQPVDDFIEAFHTDFVASPPIRFAHSCHRVLGGYSSYSFSLRRAKRNKPKPCGAGFLHDSIAVGIMVFV